MQLPKLGAIAGLAVGAAVTGGGLPALGAVIYNVPLDTTKAYPDNSFVQPNGNNFDYGDNVELQAGTPRRLTTIVVPWALYGPDANGPTYTATDLTLNLYTANPVTGLADTLIGSVNAPDVTFSPSGGYRPFIYNVTQNVTFDFTSQNIDLPDQFVIMVDDETPVDPNPQLSVWLETEDSNDAFGSTGMGGDVPREYIQDQEGAPPPFLTDGSNYNFVFQVNAIPEPGALSLLGLAGLALVRRRRTTV